jgi:hypothetical protein
MNERSDVDIPEDRSSAQARRARVTILKMMGLVAAAGMSWFSLLVFIFFMSMPT